MPQLAENTFSHADYSSRKDLVRRLNKINLELTNVGAFHPGNIVQVAESLHSAEKDLSIYLLSATRMLFSNRTEWHPFAGEFTEAVSVLRKNMAPPRRDDRVRDLRETFWRFFIIDPSYFQGVLGSALSKSALAGGVKPKQAAVEVIEEADFRLRGHEELVDQLHSIVEEEAARLNVAINRIIIRPGWSHEYEDKTSVVIYVEMQGGDEMRFSLWDSICEKIDHLGSSLPVPTRRFLNDNIFVVVNRDPLS